MKAFLKKIQNNRYEIAEAIIVELVNFYIQIIFVYKKLLGKYSFLKKNINLRNIHKNKRIFVVANAPSINDFDLKKLKNEIVPIVITENIKACIALFKFFLIVLIIYFLDLSF